MATKRRLEQRLSAVRGFEQPRADLEQYRTPADVAAHLVHLADVRGDVGGQTVVDLGTGTGMLALGTALRGAARVVGLDRDAGALRVARRNERRVGPPRPVGWVRGEAARPPLCPRGAVTVVTNPPFGAHRGREHADRAFLSTAARLASVSYSVHNAGSEGFVRAFAADNGGTVTDAYRAELSLPHQFDHHERDRETVAAEVFRVEWGGPE